MCKNYILNGLDNTLDGVHSSIKSAKALWEALDKKYNAKDANMMKFIVSKFLGFKMVDSITIVSYVQEFQLILCDIHAKGMSLNESFQVSAIIERLSSS
jgi:hypothetical protein